MNTLFYNKYILILLSVICGGMLVHTGLVRAAIVSTSPRTMATSSCSSGLSCGLVGYWTFDGNDINRGTNTMIDRSGNGNTATLDNMSTTTSSIMGVVGQGLRFDGINDAVNAGSGSSLDDIQLQGGGGMTVSFWIRPTTNATRTIIGKAAASGGTGRWSIGKSSNTNPARLTFSKQGTVTSNKNYNSLLTIGVWQHIVLTWNGSMTASTGVVVYKNAVLQVNLTATDGSGATSDAAGTLCISSDPTSATPTICNGASVFGDQDLDDVRIYNRVISTSEIQQLYNIGVVKRSTSPITTATSSCSTGLSCGLVGYWTFDGKDTPWTSATAATTLDKSGNGRTGTLTNMAQSSSTAPGIIGQGLNLDGTNDYINTSQNLSVFMSSSIGSVSVWANPREVQSVAGGCTNGGGNMIFSDALSSGGGYMWLGFDSTNVCAGLNDGSNKKINTTYTINKWTHLVWVHTGGVLSLYKDGVFVNSIAAGNIANMTAASVTFGKGYSSSSTLFKGTMDEVRVYNRALSSTEILQLYNIGAATKQASSPVVTATSSCSTGLSCGLVGYWTFDGKDTNWTTNTMVDKSGNGQTGTLTSMSTTSSPIPGKIGQAFKFRTGTSARVITSLVPATKIVNSKFSIAFWAYPLSCTGVFYSATDSGASRFYLEMLSTQSNNTCQTRGGISSWNPVPNNSAVKNVWQHYVIMLNGTDGYIYRNGVLVDSTSGITVSIPSVFLRIGDGVTAGNSFDGYIDDFRIYDRALSTVEISQLYQQGR